MHQKNYRRSDLFLPLPLQGTGVSSLAVFVGLLWELKASCFADFTVDDTTTHCCGNDDGALAIPYSIHITRLHQGSDCIPECVGNVLK